MSLKDYIREMEEKEEAEAGDPIEDGILALFQGDEKPTKEAIADFAAENDISEEEVEVKIFDLLYSQLNAEEEEEGEATEETPEGEEEEEEPVEETPDYFAEAEDEDEDESAEHEASESDEEEAAEEAEGDDDEAGEEEEEIDNPFEAGETVKNVTTDTDSLFYGKTYEVAETEGPFVRVTYIDPDGRQDLVWFKADELKAVDTGEEEEESEEEDAFEPESGEDAEEVKEESFGESHGILGYLKSGLVSING